MEKQKCITKLITDAPPNKDWFEGGSHINLALSIKDVIENEEGGKTIGLEGGWGSGKSTVIRFLVENLNNQDNFVYVFDAWAHEGDPLRRTFLEKLIHALMKKRWIKKKYAEEMLNDLSGKVITSNIKTTPKVIWTGALTGLVTLISSIGLALLNKSLNKAVSPWENNVGLDSFFLLSTALFLLPWFFLAIFAFIRKDFSFIVKEHKTEKDTISRENPDPTSVEFELIFRNIIKTVLKGNSHKLVIVLDNIDRVSKTDALNILSTLQTFLHYCQQSKVIDEKEKKEFPLERLWVIIPYDRKGIANLWDEDKKNNIASHMLDKRFQIRFYVPPLVLSNWKEYLFSLLKEAMPEHSSKEKLEKTYQIVSLTWEIYNPKIQKDDYSASKFPQPTPRQLISLINQIGAIHRQWCIRGIPYSHIVFYATFRYLNPEKMLDDPKLRSGTFPQQPISSWLSDSKIEFWESIATLWFNIDTSLASQILFKDEILSAIKNGDYKKLELTNKKTSKAWEVIKASYGLINDSFLCIEDYLNAISCLQKCDMLSKKDSMTHVGFLEIVSDGLIQNNISKPLSKEVGEQFKILLSHIRSTQLYEKLIDILNYEIPNMEDISSYSAENISGWVDACLIVLSEIDQKNFQFSPIGIPGNVDTQVAALVFITENEPDGKYWKYFNLPDNSQFCTGFTNFINSGKFKKTHLGLINFIEEMYDDNSFSWNNLLKSIDKRIKTQTSASTNLDEIVGLYNAFWSIMSISDKNKTDGDSILKKQHINQGFLMHFFWLLAEEPNIEDTAKLLFYYLTTMPNCPRPSSDPGYAITGYDHLKKGIFINPQHHSDLNNNVNNLILLESKFDLYKNIWNQTSDSRKWISYCLYLLSESTRIKEVDPSFILTNWIIIKNNLLEENWHKFLGSVIRKTLLLTNLQDQQFDINLSPQIQEIISYGKSKIIIDFSNKIIEQIREAITKDIWLTELKKPSSILFLLIRKLHENSYLVNLGLPFAEALIEFGKNILSGNIQDCINTDYFSYIGSENDRKYLHSQLLSTLVEFKGNIPSIFFECFGRELMDMEVINNKNIFIENCVIPLLDQNNIEGLQWFAEILEANPNIFINNSANYSVEILKTKVAEKLKEELENNLREILNKINSLLT